MQTYTVTIDQYGVTRWFKFNKPMYYHRLDGPAITYPSGEQGWYFEKQLHNFHGPARIGLNGKKTWALFGNKMTQEEHTEQVQGIKLQLGIV